MTGTKPVAETPEHSPLGSDLVGGRPGGLEAGS